MNLYSKQIIKQQQTNGLINEKRRYSQFIVLFNLSFSTQYFFDVSYFIPFFFNFLFTITVVFQF